MTVELSPPPRRGADLKDYIAYMRYVNAVRTMADARLREALAQAAEDGLDRTALKRVMWLGREPSEHIATLFKYLQAVWELDKKDA